MIAGAPHRSSAESAASGRYAVLTMDELALLVPQHQVQSLEPAFDVQHPEAQDLGWISAAGANWPVYCLSGDLQPIPEVPTDRHICVLLESDRSQLGVLCDQVIMLDRTGLDILPLPGCMRTPNTPLQGLVLDAEGVLCVTSADDLLDCVAHQRNPASEAEALQPLQVSAS